MPIDYGDNEQLASELMGIGLNTKPNMGTGSIGPWPHEGTPETATAILDDIDLKPGKTTVGLKEGGKTQLDAMVLQFHYIEDNEEDEDVHNLPWDGNPMRLADPSKLPEEDRWKAERDWERAQGCLSGLLDRQIEASEVIPAVHEANDMLQEAKGNSTAVQVQVARKYRKSKTSDFVEKNDFIQRLLSC